MRVAVLSILIAITCTALGFFLCMLTFKQTVFFEMNTGKMRVETSLAHLTFEHKEGLPNTIELAGGKKVEAKEDWKQWTHSSYFGSKSPAPKVKETYKRMVSLANNLPTLDPEEALELRTFFYDEKPDTERLMAEIYKLQKQSHNRGLREALKADSE